MNRNFVIDTDIDEDLIINLNNHENLGVLFNGMSMFEILDMEHLISEQFFNFFQGIKIKLQRSSKFIESIKIDNCYNLVQSGFIRITEILEINETAVIFNGVTTNFKTSITIKVELIEHNQIIESTTKYNPQELIHFKNYTFAITDINDHIEILRYPITLDNFNSTKEKATKKMHMVNEETTYKGIVFVATEAFEQLAKKIIDILDKNKIKFAKIIVNNVEIHLSGCLDSVLVYEHVLKNSELFYKLEKVNDKHFTGYIFRYVESDYDIRNYKIFTAIRVQYNDKFFFLKENSKAHKNVFEHYENPGIEKVQVMAYRGCEDTILEDLANYNYPYIINGINIQTQKELYFKPNDLVLKKLLKILRNK